MTDSERKDPGRRPIDLPVKDIIGEYIGGLSLMELAAKYEVSDMTIYNRLKKAGVPMRPRYRKYGKKVSPRLKEKDSMILLKIKEYRNMGLDSFEIARLTDTSVRDIIEIVKGMN